MASAHKRRTHKAISFLSQYLLKEAVSVTFSFLFTLEDLRVEFIRCSCFKNNYDERFFLEPDRYQTIDNPQKCIPLRLRDRSIVEINDSTKKILRRQNKSVVQISKIPELYNIQLFRFDHVLRNLVKVGPAIQYVHFYNQMKYHGYISYSDRSVEIIHVPNVLHVGQTRYLAFTLLAKVELNVDNPPERNLENCLQLYLTDFNLSLEKNRMKNQDVVQNKYQRMDIRQLINVDRNELKANSLNQFFTDPVIAQQCILHVCQILPQDPHNYLWIDSCAGYGSFYHQFPNNSPKIGIDIDTGLRDRFPEYVYMDFLDTDPDILGIARVPQQHIIICSNFPFSNADITRNRGGGQNMALVFLNHASKLGDIVGCIVGANFNRLSVQNKVDPQMHLVYNEILPRNTFLYNDKHKKINALFQIWMRKYDSLGRPILRRNQLESVPDLKNGKWEYPDGRPGDFEVLFPTDYKANLAVQRWGTTSNVGDVIDHPSEVRQLVDAANAKEEQRKQGKSNIYNSNYKLGRSSLSFFHLYADDPHYVAEKFRHKKPEFAQYCKHLTSGSNPNINLNDLLRIYGDF